MITRRKTTCGNNSDGGKRMNGISRVEGRKGCGLLHWLRLKLGTGSWVRLLAGPLRVACIDSEFIRHAKLTFNTETWRFVCKLIGPSMPLSAAVTSLASLFMGLHPLHTHTHTHTYVRNNARGTLWQFEIGLAHPSANAVASCQMRLWLWLFRPASVICVTRKSLSIYCAVSFLFRQWRRAANQNQKGNWQFNCRGGDGAGGKEGCTMPRPITYADAACQAVLLHEHPYFPTSSLPSFLPSFQHLHVYFFESTLSFFLTLRQLWLMDWLADQTSDQPNWPVDHCTIGLVDHWTNWTDWQNADRLTPALAVSSCQSYPVPFHLHSFARFELSFL